MFLPPTKHSAATSPCPSSCNTSSSKQLMREDPDLERWNYRMQGKGCRTVRFWEERIRDRNVLNTATPPALCKLCWRSLEARAAPGRALTPSLCPSQSTGKEIQGWLQGLLLPSLAALVPPCVLHLFRDLTQNPTPLLWSTSHCQTEMLCFLLHPTEKLSMSGGHQRFSQNIWGLVFFLCFKKTLILAL